MIGATAANPCSASTPFSCFKTFVKAFAIPSAKGSIIFAQLATDESNQSRRLQAGRFDLESAGKFVASSSQVFAISKATWESVTSCEPTGRSP